MIEWSINKIKTDDPNVISSCMTKDEFDFNKLIPMPKSLDMQNGFITAKAIACYLTNRFQQPIEKMKNKEYKEKLINWGIKDIEKSLKEMSEEELDKLYELGKQYMFNKENYGHYTWYSWRYEFWGSHYNACDTKYSDDHPCEVSFKTMWDTPICIFVKMCSMFPNAKIEFYYEEDCDNIRRFINNNGVLKEIYGEEQK